MMNSFRRYCGKFVSRIVKDFRHKELFPLKILFFVHASTLFVLYPYLTIHMRELGINVEETAIMSAVTPVIAIIMPPLAGMVADKIGNFKLLLSVFSCLGGGASLLLLLVPVGRITVTYPDEVMFSLGCHNLPNNTGEQHNFIGFQLAEDYPCNRTGRPESALLEATLQTCGFLCKSAENLTDAPDIFQPRSSEEDEDELSVNSVLKARSYILTVTDPTTKLTAIHQYNLSSEEISHKQTKQESLSERFLRNNENYGSAIRRISYCQYFLPTRDMYEFSCSPHEEEASDTSFLLSSSARFSRMRRSLTPSQYACRIKQTQNSTNENAIRPASKFTSQLLSKSKESGRRKYFKSETLEWSDKKIEPLCNGEEEATQITGTVFLHNPDNDMEIMHKIELEQCQLSCLLTSPRKDVCNNMKKEVVYDPSLTFWVYLTIRVFIGIIGGAAFAMFEGAIIAVLREQNADYGLQRIYASIGGMISSPLSGIMIDYASQGKGYTDFRPAFYLYAALKLLGGALMLTINLEFKVGADNVISDILLVLKKIEVIALLVACFILGTAWGYIESFLFWLIQDLGGSRSLMGITITVGGIAGIPLLALSGPIIKKIGHANVIFIGFIFYAIRLAGYSVIYNPWHCLFFEALESVTTSLAFTAAVTYAAKLSSRTTDSSIQGLLGGLYFGVGKGAGSLVGGYLMKGFGTRITFRTFAVFTAIMGVIYYLFNRFYIETRQIKEEEEEEPKKKGKGYEVEVITEKPMNGSQINGDAPINNNSEQPPTKIEDGTHDNPAFDPDGEDKTDNEKTGRSEREETKEQDQKKEKEDVER